MKEQIEEMRKDLIEIFDEEYEKRRLITPDFTAEKMTAKGYRKQKEGEWIVTYEYNEYRMYKEAKITCSVCGHKPKYEGYLSDMNFCPSCGAKMKGGE